MFSGTDADWVTFRRWRIRRKCRRRRLFGYGPNQSLEATIDNKRRFRDGLLARL